MTDNMQTVLSHFVKWLLGRMTLRSTYSFGSRNVAGVLMRLRNLAVAFIMVPVVAGASDVSSVFHDGLFGVPWGASLEAVATIFPDGNVLPNTLSGYVTYVIRDDQTFLGVLRGKNVIIFGIDEKNKVSVVSIGYPYAMRENLRSAVTQMLGPPASTDFGQAGVRRYSWTGIARNTLGATISEDTSTIVPLLWLTIGTPDYRSAAKKDNCVGK